MKKLLVIGICSASWSLCLAMNVQTLNKAAADGRLTDVQKAVGQIDIKKTDDHGRTALHQAADQGRYDIVQFLLAYAEKNNIVGDAEYQPHAGDEIPVTDKERAYDAAKSYAPVLAWPTAIFGPEWYDVAKMGTEILLDIGSEAYLEMRCKGVGALSKRPYVNFLTKHNATALHYAAAKGHADIVTLLLDHGAYVLISAKSKEQYQEDRMSGNALHVACLHGQLEVAKILFEHGGKGILNTIDVEKRTPLHYAAMSGEWNLIEYLLNQGALDSILDAHEKSPFHYALEGKHFVVAMRMLERERGVDGRSDDRLTTLHLTAMAGDVDEAAALEKRGFKFFDLTDSKGWQPLQTAAYYGHIPFVEWLLMREPTIAERASSSLQVPCIAVRAGHYDLVECLFNKKFKVDGAFNNVSHGGVERLTSYMEWAMEEGYPDFIDFLHRNGVNQSEGSLYMRDLWNLLADKGTFLGRYPTPKTKQYGITALHHAAETKHELLIQVLFETIVAFELAKQCEQSYTRLMQRLKVYIDDENNKLRDAHTKEAAERHAKGLPVRPFEPKKVSWKTLQAYKHDFFRNPNPDDLWDILCGACWHGFKEATGSIVSVVRDALAKEVFGSLPKKFEYTPNPVNMPNYTITIPVHEPLLRELEQRVEGSLETFFMQKGGAHRYAGLTGQDVAQQVRKDFLKKADDEDAKATKHQKKAETARQAKEKAYQDMIRADWGSDERRKHDAERIKQKRIERAQKEKRKKHRDEQRKYEATASEYNVLADTLGPDEMKRSIMRRLKQWLNLNENDNGFSF